MKKFVNHLLAAAMITAGIASARPASAQAMEQNKFLMILTSVAY
jgi:hypothetical protein